MPILLNAGASPRGWSRLSTILRCPQQYAYTYILSEEDGGGRSGGNSPALIKGSLIHTGLAHHYRRMMADQQGEDREQWYEPMIAMQFQAAAEGVDWIDCLEASQDCVKDYISHYGVEEFKVVAVEEMISTQIGEHLVTGRADLIIQQRSTGKVWIVDHKSTGRISGAQSKYYGISGQLIGYEYMGREIFGEHWGGMLLNQVQHTKPKYNRVELPPAPNMLARFPQVVRDAEERIAQLESRDVHNYPMAMNELTCYHRYGACNFVDKCRWGKSI
jgi:hypothetical protein